MSAAVDEVAVIKGKLVDITVCCICFETFKVPKLLPCVHTFCLKCLEDYGEKIGRGAGEKLPCPLCRQEFTIPVKGFVELPKNIFMDRLIETISVLSAASFQCDPCTGEVGEDNEVPKAKVFCSDCQQKLCEDCCKYHQKIKMTKNHKLVELESKEMITEGVVEAVLPSYCSTHENMSLKMYCADCKAVVCPLCFINDHKNHNGSQIDEVIQGFRNHIQKNIDDFQGNVANAVAKVETLETGKTDVCKQISNLKQEVARTSDDLKMLVDKHANTLLLRLDSLQQEKLKEYQTEKDDFDWQITCLETYKSYCSGILTKGSPIDICRDLNDLEIRASDLRKSYESMMLRQVLPLQVFFKQRNLHEYQEQGQNIVGVLKERRYSKRKPQSEGDVLLAHSEIGEYSEKATLIHTIKTKSGKTSSKEIWGLTVLDEEIFIVHDSSSEIEVYDAETFLDKRQLQVTELVDAQDITSCHKNKCVYVMNWPSSDKYKEILKIDKNGKTLKKWCTEYDHGRLSVGCDEHVIVTIMWKNTLKEYTPDGELVAEIKPMGVIHPRHAVKHTAGQYIVSYGELEDIQHGVCIVNDDGALIKSFGGQNVTSVGQLCCPLAIAVDEDGSVIVADKENCRIILLSASLDFRQVLATNESGLQDPWRLYYDCASGRLYVADNDEKNKNYRVLILDVK